MTVENATPVGARAQAGYVLTVYKAGEVDELLGVDCVRCAATICEASPHTIAGDPWWLLNELSAHERTHHGPALVEVVRP